MPTAASPSPALGTGKSDIAEAFASGGGGKAFGGGMGADGGGMGAGDGGMGAGGEHTYEIYSTTAPPKTILSTALYRTGDTPLATSLL